MDRAIEITKEIGTKNPPRNNITNESLQSLRKALARAFWRLGRVARHEDNREHKEATYYESAVQIDPNHIPALRDLAFILATRAGSHPDSEDQSLSYASRACELSQYKNAECLVSLAAAFAKNGNFTEAIRWQQSAIEHLPEGHSDQELISRLKYYRLGQHEHKQRVNPLVAWWPITEADRDQITDASGNGHHGTFIDNAHMMIDPQRGAVLALDGQGDRIDCGQGNGLNQAQEITVAAWIKVTEFDKRVQGLASNGSWNLARRLSRHTLSFSCQGPTKFEPSTLDEHVSVGPKMPVDDGQWHHVVGVYDGIRINQYIDGELDCSAWASGQLILSNQPLFIGTGTNRNRKTYWKGWIDDVRIYNYPLNQNEIKSLYLESREP